MTQERAKELLPFTKGSKEEKVRQYMTTEEIQYVLKIQDILGVPYTFTQALGIIASGGHKKVLKEQAMRERNFLAMMNSNR